MITADKISLSTYWRPVALTAGLLLALVALFGIQGNGEDVALYGHSALIWLSRRWLDSGGDLSHGWLIPLVSLYAVWQRRRELAAAPRQVFAPALILIVGALVLHWAGMRTQQTRLSIIALIGLLWSLPLYLLGWPVARRLIFACSYLLFCIPYTFLTSMTVPLRIQASKIATLLLQGIGIPVLHHGSMIKLLKTDLILDVADPCSGLRSLLALTALTAAFAYFTQKTLLKQWLLFLSAIPLAMIGNTVRIMTIALVANTFGVDMAMKLYHDFSGFLLFTVATLLMLGVSNVLNRDYGKLLSQWKNDSQSTTPPPSA